MKLSEAIRLGAMLRPKNDALVSDRGTCAIGAALDAEALIPERWFDVDFDVLYAEAEKRWPLLVAFVPHPFHPEHPLKLWRVIVSLNDRHKWTREQIADFVETLESQVSRVLSPGEEEKDQEEYARVDVWS
jgi:hypothetical protein